MSSRPPEGAGPCSGRPVAAAVAPTLVASRTALPLARGFTLIELLVVLAIIAIGTAGVGLAMRDGAQAQLAREGQRLVALLESARAQSRLSGVPVRWVAVPGGFRFEGLAPQALPERWLDTGTSAMPATGAGAAANAGAALNLGPEPLIGAQGIQLHNAQSPDQQLLVASDGLRPFALYSGEKP